jgi:His/Glu/Gln/Arg/opine family amino acid ABC transporter permease subunit
MDIALTPLWNGRWFLLQALWTTVAISLVSMLLGVVIGLAVGTARTYGPCWLDRILAFYVDSVRAIPVLVVLVWTYFAFPLLAGTSVDAFTAASVALGFHLGAYVAETIRAGLTSVRPGQTRAALALGMSQAQVIRTIILPQALIRMLPNLGSLLVIAIKDSAIASVIAVPELMRQSQILAGRTYRPFEIYTAIMLVYFCLCYPVARGVDRIHRRLAHLGAS